MRHTRKDALKDTDLVILAGAICDFRLSYGRSLPSPKRGKVIVINRDRQKMLMVSFHTKSTIALCTMQMGAVFS